MITACTCAGRRSDETAAGSDDNDLPALPMRAVFAAGGAGDQAVSQSGLVVQRMR